MNNFRPRGRVVHACGRLRAYLGDGGEPATILSAGVSKGRDYEFHGAVDGLRINDTVFDFEETGVVERDA